MSKKDKKQSAPNFSPAALLRPRLDGLWRDEVLLHKDAATMQADLDVLVRGIKPDQFVPILLRAYLAASLQARTHLDTILPTWLCARDSLPVLEKMVASPSLDEEARKQALAWLAASGRDALVVTPTAENLFYQAYDLDDKSQALVVVLWYTDVKKRRVYGMGFLIDYNPPWDGAIKDVMLYPKLDPRDAKRKYIDIWAEDGQALTPIRGATAKTKILQCLECNRRSKIRLPRDLIANRDAFARFVLALPDASDTPKFTAADWDALTRQPQTVEEIRRVEQTIGRRVRMEDGKELWILGNLDDET